MAQSTAAQTVAGLAAVLAGGTIAVGYSFGQLSGAPAVAGDVETLLRYTFEVAPVAVVLVAGILILRGMDVL
jgi:hypothetical protein